MSNPCIQLITFLRDKISKALDPVVPIGSRCAVVDFPNYANVGDSAIWLGQIAYLRDRQARIAYVCEQKYYSKSQLESRIGKDGLIIITGGGNFGDLWPHHQLFREQIIRDFPHHRIVQLPQSIHFIDPNRLASCRQLIANHSQFTLVVRDNVSLNIGISQLNTNTLLCPDMAFCLGPLARPTSTQPIAWQSRMDKEASSENRPGEFYGLSPTDWLTEHLGQPLRFEQRFASAKQSLGNIFPPLHAIHLILYNYLANERLKRGIQLLSKGDVVVTNRLHGYIMCLLLGIPHYVSDNNYGKIGEFHRAWTQDNPLTHWHKSEQEALEMAINGHNE